MEWTWREQILLLLQCGGLGLLLGMVYDWISVWGQLRRLSRVAVFWLDSLYGLLAALITFFFALATMDGRLHPMLFAGSAAGVTVQRYGISRFHRRVLYGMGRLIQRVTRYCLWPFAQLRSWLALLLEKGGKIIKKSCQKLKKTRKKTCNSEPNLLK